MKHKKIILTVVSVLLSLALVAGLAVYLAKRNDHPVSVYNIEENWLYTTYWDNSNTSYGQVTTDQLQTVYLSDTQEITGIKVKEGQQVKKGDVLVTYDTTLSQLSLDRQKMEIEKQKMRLTDAQEQLKEIKKMKPIVYKPGTTPAPTTKPTENNKDFGTLEDDYKFIKGKGTLADPKIIWVREDLSFDSELIEDILEEHGDGTLYALLVTLKDNLNTGEELSRIGVRFQRTLVIQVGGNTGNQPTPTEPADTTNPTDPSDPTEPSDPTDPSEPSEPSEPEDPSEPSEPEDPSEPTEPSEPEEPQFKYSFSFFPVEEEKQEDTGNTGSSGASIDYNSGYTSSEIAQMRADKEAEIKELQFTIKMAEAEYKIMQKEFDNGGVVCEVDGYVVSVLSAEEAALSGEPLVKVSAGGGFMVTGTVSELKRDELQIGSAVQLHSWETTETCTGTIVEVGDYPVTDNMYSGSNFLSMSYYPFTVYVEESESLRADSYVEITYEAVTTDEDLFLDAAFVRSENGTFYVYVQGTDGLLEKREVQVGGTIYDGYYVQILGGLSRFDNIAFPYGNDVREGAETVVSSMDELSGSVRR